MFIDTHCHPYLSKKRKQEDLYQNFINAWGHKMICIGTDPSDSKICIDLSKKYPKEIYATVWVHPCSIECDWESLVEFLDILAKKTDLTEIVWALEEYYLDYSENIVGIGECWLDYHWLQSLSEKYNVDSELLKELQKYYFKSQIRLAKKLSLPFIIHNRNSWEDVWEILCEENYGNFILHSFTENYDYAKKCLEKFPESKISFSWILTFKNTQDIQEAAQKIPLTNILIETDSPYLTPEPLRWQDENQPAYTKHVLDYIIDLRFESPEEIEKQIYQNSLDIFWI